MMQKHKAWIDELEKCPNCGSTHLIRNYERGELICQDCGLVIDDKFIDQGPEWRAFDNDQYMNRARAGTPSTFMIHDKGLSTEISFSNEDSYGKKIPIRNRSQVYRLRKWNSRIKSLDGRNLSIALQELDRISGDIGIPRDVRETAAMLYRKAMTMKMIRGRSIEALVSASIYAACRMHNIPRTLEEISRVTKVSRKNIARAYRIENRFLKFGLIPQSPMNYIEYFRDKLRLSIETKEKAIEILSRILGDKKISGKGPVGIAIAALYIAAVLNNERKSQREFADAAGITEVTLRNRYKEIAGILGMNIGFH
ncbi:MAG: transcription initiation factor IIB [Thermoplasmata archaeon]